MKRRCEFWGSRYARLLSIKKKGDPTYLLTVHKGVGSEGDWWRARARVDSSS